MRFFERLKNKKRNTYSNSWHIMDELHWKYFYLFEYFTIHCKLLLMWNERHLGTISYYSFYSNVLYAIWWIFGQKRIQPKIVIVFRRYYRNWRNISIKSFEKKLISALCNFICRIFWMCQWTYIYRSNAYLLVVLS